MLFYIHPSITAQTRETERRKQKTEGRVGYNIERKQEKRKRKKQKEMQSGAGILLTGSHAN